MNQNAPAASLALTDYLYNKASRAGVPLSGTFELSPVCNFACRMCYVRKTPQEVAAHSRPLMTLDRWLDLAARARDRGMLYLLLTGGEPFLWPDFWTLYEQLVQMGLFVSINTNGSLIDAQAVRRLQSMPPKRVNITLYGAGDAAYGRLCRAPGMFGRVDRAITALQAAGVQVKLNCSLTPDNVGDLEAMVAYAQQRKLILEVASYMFPPVRRDPGMTGRNERFTPQQAARSRLQVYRLQNGPERYKAYLQQIQAGCVPPPGLDEGCVDPVDGKIRCRAGKASFWVTWDGWLTPCGMMPEPRLDLYTQGFDQAWGALIEVSQRQRLSGVCAKCPNSRLCHACAAMALAETGTTGGIPVYLCDMVEAMRAQARQELEGEPC